MSSNLPGPTLILLLAVGLFLLIGLIVLVVVLVTFGSRKRGLGPTGPASHQTYSAMRNEASGGVRFSQGPPGMPGTHDPRGRSPRPEPQAGPHAQQQPEDPEQPPQPGNTP